MALLSIGSDPKTSKGEDYGVLTAAQYFAPANISGFDVCVDRSVGCGKACLYTSGHGVIPIVQNARIARTRLFFTDRKAYALQLETEILRHVKKSEKLGMEAAMRPNATADLPWERIKLTWADGSSSTIVEKFGDVLTLYDYSKTLKRALAQPYNLTFSLSETNKADALIALEHGVNVAVVFQVSNHHKSGEAMLPLPETWNGYQVVDGDLSDIRFRDPRGVVVGLRMKGKATADATGFVQPNVNS
jgi:hypothetical protein